MEDRITALEARVAALEHENLRLAAINEIQNLMSRYEYLFAATMYSEVAQLFAQKADGVFISIGGVGVFEGPAGVDRMFNKFFKLLRGDDLRGSMRVHALTTSVIQVAADGMSAKAIWTSPGHETEKDRETGLFDASWVWSYYECTFIKEDGVWKFLNYTLYPIIKSPYEKSWINSSYLPPEGPPLPPELAPDKPNPKWTAWSAENVRGLEPVPPLPYGTL